MRRNMAEARQFVLTFRHEHDRGGGAAGRPMMHSVRIGFNNAMSAVLDANVTTIIAAIVLLFFGTGSVQGFATTLLLGVIASMITAIVVTRFLLTRMVRIVSKPELFTSAKPEIAKEAN